MRLDDDIANLKRTGADPSRARVSDGRIFNTFNVRGFEWKHLLLSAAVGASLTVGCAAATHAVLGYTVASPSEEKILVVIRAAAVQDSIAEMSAGDLRARISYDPKIAAALAHALDSDLDSVIYAVGRYLEQAPTSDDRERAASNFRRLAEIGAQDQARLNDALGWADLAGRSPDAARAAMALVRRESEDKGRVEAAYKIAHAITPEDAPALATVIENYPDLGKNLANFNVRQQRALVKLAIVAGPATNDADHRLAAAEAWLGDGKPLPKCDNTVIPYCRVDDVTYGANCPERTYPTIRPACASCPWGSTPRRLSDGTIECVTMKGSK